LVIETQRGKRHEFKAEIADNRERRQQGLMYRQEMADNAAMLFLFDEVRIVTFWMRNTFIPLDLLFLGIDGRIMAIHRNAVPASTSPISSPSPAAAVLEIKAGTAAKLGIYPGDQVLHERLR
jgi:uncharacterized membrane protein (UPF0127 family)